MSTVAEKRCADGYILAEGVYSLVEIEKRLGLTASALRQARRKGLIVRRCGKRAFILGRDLIAYLESAEIDHKK